MNSFSNTRLASSFRRGKYGPSRFFWNKDSLGIIIRGFFQFHRSPLNHPLHAIAPHLRALIRDYVKEVVVNSHGGSDQVCYRFDLICSRWVRIPSLRAVLLKLQDCAKFVTLVKRGSSQTSYEDLLHSKIMSPMFYDAMMNEFDRRSLAHSATCSSFCLPALPRVTSVPVFGYCFMCGVGLSDKIDFGLVPRCSCHDGGVGGGGDIYLCSWCIEDDADD